MIFHNSSWESLGNCGWGLGGIWKGFWEEGPERHYITVIIPPKHPNSVSLLKILPVLGQYLGQYLVQYLVQFLAQYLRQYLGQYLGQSLGHYLGQYLGQYLR